MMNSSFLNLDGLNPGTFRRFFCSGAEAFQAAFPEAAVPESQSAPVADFRRDVLPKRTRLAMIF